MVIRRGEIWWAELPAPTGAEPGFRRPMLVVQSDQFNASRIGTVLAVALTSNLALAKMPGNVLVRAKESGLSRDSVVNVSQVVTLDRRVLVEKAGLLPAPLLLSVAEGLKTVLELW